MRPKSSVKPLPNPESGSDDTHELDEGQGIVILDTPLVKDELIVIKIGNIDFDAISTSTKFTLQVQDEKEDSVLTITTFPRSGKTALATAIDSTTVTLPMREAFSLDTEHYILVHKEESQFLVQYDSHPLGSVEAPPHSSLLSITYDLGTQSGFRGPISAAVYSSFSNLRALFVPKDSPKAKDDPNPTPPLPPPMSKEALFQQIVACDPRDAENTVHALEDLRREITAGKLSSSGAKWKGKQSPGGWADIEWSLGPHSVCVIRFKATKETSNKLNIAFGPMSLISLQIFVAPNGTVEFYEARSRNDFFKYHTVQLAESLHTPGEHSIAVVNDGGKVIVIFDFKQSVVLPRTTVLVRNLKQVHVDLPNGVSTAHVELDVYEFGG